MKLVLTDEAQRDLIEIGDYIARDNRQRAVTFVKELRSAMSVLMERPEAFPIVPRYVHLGIRRRLYGNYLIFYRCDDVQIAVIRVLHGARDYESLLDLDS